MKFNFILNSSFFGLVIILISLTGCNLKNESLQKIQTNVNSEAPVPHEYWTCSMHPHIHSNKPGECPICGMPLIKVKEMTKVKNDALQGFEPSENQLKNSQISKYTVKRKDIVIQLPVSGRLVSSKEVMFQVYESDLEFLNTGTIFSGALANDSKQKLTGKIINIDKLIDPSSRTVRVTGLLQNSPNNFVSDISFHGFIEKTLKKVIAIPVEAVLHTGTRDLVYVFSSENKISAKEVQLGLKNKDDYEIKSGLSEGDIVSAGANFLIDSESKIRGQ